MKTFLEWSRKEININDPSGLRHQDLQTGWNAALEAVLENNESLSRVIVEDTKEGRALVIKLALSKPGEIIRLTAEESKAFDKLRIFP